MCVIKYRQLHTDCVMLQRIRSTVDEKEQKQLLMDLEVVMKSNECPCIVQFYGALFKEGDCWICMELMDTSLDKFYKFIYEKLQRRIPESILGKITVAVSIYTSNVWLNGRTCSIWILISFTESYLIFKNFHGTITCEESRRLLVANCR